MSPKCLNLKSRAYFSALSKSNMENSRNHGLDILRVLASYLVIQVHTGEFYYISPTGTVLSGENPFWVGVLNSICRTAVPLFVMISGFLLLPIKEEMTPFFKKRFTRVAIPFVIWCVLYAVYGALKRQSTWLVLPDQYMSRLPRWVYYYD